MQYLENEPSATDELRGKVRSFLKQEFASMFGASDDE